MILVKNLKFFYPLCLSKIHREKVFAHVLDKKEAKIKTKIMDYLLCKNANFAFVLNPCLYCLKRLVF